MKYFDPVVTERYAQAFYAVARRKGATDQVLADAEVLLGMVPLADNLAVFLASPQITTEQKIGLFEKAMRGRVNDVLVDLFDLLLKKGRIDHARPIVARFRELVEREKGIFEARVETAVPLDEAQRRTLQSSLEAYTQSSLLIRFTVDPKVIGGVRFRCGDLLIDDTVAGKLHRLRGKLEEAAKR